MQTTIISPEGDVIEVIPAPVLPLADAKAAMWAEAKLVRDAHIDGGVDVPPIGRFDSDPLSRSNINGAVTGAMLAAQAGQPFSISWKLADNTVATLNGAQTMAAGMAVLAHVAACHANSQVMGLAIQAAANHAALDEIDIETGWP